MNDLLRSISIIGVLLSIFFIPLFVLISIMAIFNTFDLPSSPFIFIILRYLLTFIPMMGVLILCGIGFNFYQQYKELDKKIRNRSDR